MYGQKEWTGIKSFFIRIVLIFIVITGGVCVPCYSSPNTKNNQKNTNISGCDEFLIGIFWPPVWEQTNEKQYKWIKEANVNFIQNVHGDLLDTRERNIKMLQLSKKFGLKFIVADSRINGSESAIKAMIRDYGKYKEAIGYHIVDEPGVNSLESVAELCKKVQLQDNNKILFVNLLPEWAVPNYESDYVDKWIEKAGNKNIKYLSFDNYPFFKNGTFRDSYFKNLNIIRKAGLKNGVKTASYLQSIGIADVYRRPNEAEMRYCAYINLAYGIKNVIWFTYWTPTNRGEVFTDAIIDPKGNKTDLYEPFKKINGEIRQLGKRLINLDAVDVYHSGLNLPEGVDRLPDSFFFQPDQMSDELIISHLKNVNGGDYIMVVNKSISKGSKFTFHIKGSAVHLYEVSASTGRNKKINFDLEHKSFSEDFLPGEGKLYQIN